ncbi:hypothetical protein P171DRAFT_55819 [Karstenula rhodostoma CBS 690.94]|uniref:Uncharacterized protein n=1 Tax=Karstenula rhodostoma CBS 690.94 TaxID=1392251 RepID=A0A9P4U964_9PLEO|nr:hypothetical protein P171DRAFT_55819 [Karstenula rhodostoma CBS 690.94]
MGRPATSGCMPPPATTRAHYTVDPFIYLGRLRRVCAVASNEGLCITDNGSDNKQTSAFTLRLHVNTTPHGRCIRFALVCWRICGSRPALASSQAFTNLLRWAFGGPSADLQWTLFSSRAEETSPRHFTHKKRAWPLPSARASHTHTHTLGASDTPRAPPPPCDSLPRPHAPSLRRLCPQPARTWPAASDGPPRPSRGNASPRTRLTICPASREGRFSAPPKHRNVDL